MGRREQIRGRLEAATPGPWRLNGEALQAGPPPPADDAHDIDWSEWADATTDIFAGDVWRVEDGDLCAHAPSDLRDLLAVADEMESVADAIAQWRMVGSLPPADLKLAHAMEKNIRAALDRLDNGGDR